MSDQQPDAPEGQGTSHAIAGLPRFEPERFINTLDDLDITEAQKLELLSTLWWIMAAFVDMGWGVDSVQYAIPELSKLASDFPSDAVEQKDAHTAGDFNEAATDAASMEGNDDQGI